MHVSRGENPRMHRENMRTPERPRLGFVPGTLSLRADSVKGNRHYLKSKILKVELHHVMKTVIKVHLLATKTDILLISRYKEEGSLDFTHWTVINYSNINTSLTWLKGL